MSAMTWFIILCVAGAAWLLLWLFTRPKGGNNDNQN